MLKIKKVKRYKIARYPRGAYYEKTDSLSKHLVKKGAFYGSLLALLETCDCVVGGTGPPPVAPELVTENEARAIIKKVFVDNAIPMTDDVNYILTDSSQVVLDGYNDSLKLGYEYVFYPHDTTFTDSVKSNLRASTDSHVDVIDTEHKTGDYQKRLEDIVTDFLDSLRSSGII